MENTKLITLNKDYSSSNEEQKRLLTNYTKLNKIYKKTK